MFGRAHVNAAPHMHCASRLAMTAPSTLAIVQPVEFGRWPPRAVSPEYLPFAFIGSERGHPINAVVELGGYPHCGIVGRGKLIGEHLFQSCYRGPAR